MNILRKVLPHQAPKLIPRWFAETNAGSEPPKKLIIEQLKKRALLRVQGPEVAPFLQGLITNDIFHLIDKPTVPTSMYAMFLNKSGRVLYDTIIFRTSEPNLFYIECDQSAATELRQHLLLYRVRRKIDVDAFDDAYKLWVVYDTELNSAVALPTNAAANSDSHYFIADPRLKDLGLRVLVPSEVDYTQLAQQFTSSSQLQLSPATSAENYRLHRYRCGVGEGVLEIPAGKAFPLEANCDFLHGVSFNKGCYVGQELTARVFHTGVVRKRYMPVRLTANVVKEESAVQNTDGVKVGVLRGLAEKCALALLRVEQAFKAEHLVIEGKPCYVEKPGWWPKEMPVKGSMREAV